MSENYEPELGQMLFSNSEWYERSVPPWMESGLDALGDLVAQGVFANNPTTNSGAEFANDTFQMQAYCWCDGEQHPDGCPPNFVCGDFAVRWYKHSHRGATMSREITFDEWRSIFTKCVNSLEEHGEAPDGNDGTQREDRDDDPSVAA